MKVVIPTNDQKLIEKKSGHAKYFAVYEINNKEIKLHQLIENTHNQHNHAAEKNQHHEHSHDEQAKQFAQFDAFIVQHLGSHFKTAVADQGVTVYFTKKTEIKEAITEYLKDA